MDYVFSCYDSSSISESSTKFSGVLHVTDPQSHDGMHVILFYLHLYLLVVQVLQVHCNNSVHTLGRGSNSKNFGFDVGIRLPSFGIHAIRRRNCGI